MEITALETRIETIEKKLDTVLSLLGHGRKSHAEIQRETQGIVEGIMRRGVKATGNKRTTGRAGAVNPAGGE